MTESGLNKRLIGSNERHFSSAKAYAILGVAKAFRAFKLSLFESCHKVYSNLFRVHFTLLRWIFVYTEMSHCKTSFHQSRVPSRKFNSIRSDNFSPRQPSKSKSSRLQHPRRGRQGRKQTKMYFDMARVDVWKGEREGVQRSSRLTFDVFVI